ncbi:hypothetical protein APY04_0790 [Hyphomicrobium sulfonivorans]|uniref:Uncharacterized protein n=2 Tax=Hyphomicrobium sulfonivorans TaxID=121290 RepID=A0A109BKY4_HYPSL|nr:hypothetical protein APY04_0790 [Hyphomicrobium sulfonivorans]
MAERLGFWKQNAAINVKGWRSDFDRSAFLDRFFYPKDVADKSIEGRKAMVRRLANAISAEARRGAQGHPSYSRPHHLNLQHAHRAETLAVQAMQAETYLEAAE